MFSFLIIVQNESVINLFRLMHANGSSGYDQIRVKAR